MFTTPSAAAAPGIYIHLPFCVRKCAYCNFLTYPARGLVEPYLEALAREIACAGARRNPEWLPFDTLYFGGGSPSLLPPDRICNFIGLARSALGLADQAEISLEANPEDVDPHRAEIWLAANVNRITLGVQSFRQITLEAMGRAASPVRIQEAVRVLRQAGAANLGLDLIVGLPGETRADFLASLEQAIALEVEHLSLYLLEVDEKSVLGRRAARGAYRFCSEDVVCDFYLQAIALLEANGFQQYEISNFARSDRRSRHNCKYWDFAPYLGFGCGAHGFDGLRRRHNPSDIRQYVARVMANGCALEEEEDDSVGLRQREWVFLQLRQTKGISPQEYETCFGAPWPQSWQDYLSSLIAEGLAVQNDAAFRLTPRGMLLSSEICLAFFQ